MKTCDCGCIEKGLAGNFDPVLACKCAVCSGHDNEIWVHRVHYDEKWKLEEPKEQTIIEPALQKDLLNALNRECDGCQCPRCKKVRKFLDQLTSGV